MKLTRMQLRALRAIVLNRLDLEPASLVDRLATILRRGLTPTRYLLLQLEKKKAIRWERVRPRTTAIEVTLRCIELGPDPRVRVANHAEGANELSA